MIYKLFFSITNSRHRQHGSIDYTGQ